jgi:NDP-sugar pyrophosphorylase family protein
MFPLANRPLLDWILESLAQKGVTKVVLAVNYMADILKQNFASLKHGIKIVYSYERKPLGTGGPIKNAERFLNEDGNPFFMLNGDILSSIDYSNLYAAHRATKAEATIALREVEDPSRFGVVELNGKNQIQNFVEKPNEGQLQSKLINAGVYTLNQSIFSLIPNGRKISIEREIFPKLVKNRSLFGYKFDGFWIDIGKPNDYIAANKLVLDRIARNEPFLEKEIGISSKAKIIPPVAIGSNTIIGDDSQIGPYSSIGDNVTIAKGTNIMNSVVFPKAWIDRFTSINGAIIGEGAIIGQWVKIEDQCIVGDHAVIGDNVTLTQKVQICPRKELNNSVLQPATIM